MVKKTNKPYAKLDDKTVQAIVHSLFKFPNAMQAQLFASRFADTVTVSLRRPGGGDRKSVVLWVEDFALNAADRKAGFLGHYAKISPVELKDGKWTLNMKKVDMPLIKHPVKGRVEQGAKKPAAKVAGKKPAAKKAKPAAKSRKKK